MTKIVDNIIAYGFRALSGYTLCITIAVLILYGILWIAKMTVKGRTIETAELKSLVIALLSFALTFKILDYFLI